MNYVGLGIVVTVLFLIFLCLYFWSSGAMLIDETEKKEIEKLPPDEFKKDLEAEKAEEEAELKRNDDPDYSRG